jgi:hypothetical protein
MRSSIFPSVNSISRCLDLQHLDSSTDWYFLGDVHADPFCLEWTFKFLESVENFHLCFLGDLFDRGPDELLCYEEFLNFAIKHPGKVVWVAGNHDTLVNRSDNYSDHLVLKNAQKEHLREILSALPVCLLLPNDIVAVHGGFSNKINALIRREFGISEAQYTFVQNGRLRCLTTTTNTCHSSIETKFDSNDLIEMKKDTKTSKGLSLLIRGHDHPEKGYHWLIPSRTPGILTLMGSSILGVRFTPQLHRQWTTLAKLSKWNKLEVIRLHATGKSSIMMQHTIS